MSQEGAPSEVSRELLESISRAMRVLSDDNDDALRESFRMAARGLAAERAFLARVDPRRDVAEVIDAHGLNRDELIAVQVGRSSPGLSVSVLRKALQTGHAQHVEDTRRVVGDLARTGSLRGGEWSVVCVPVVEPHARTPLAVLYFQTNCLGRALTAAVLPHVQSYAAALAFTWPAWRQPGRELRPARSEPAASRAGSDVPRGVEIIGESEQTRALRERLDKLVLPAMAAPRPDAILILGPTGSGKEVVARYLHASSRRARGRFVALNCATLRGDLVESKLFGHVKGAYTGAGADADGLFVVANGGVLFLDEVGDMPPEGQSALLRALEARSVRPVGGREERPVDVQVMCATHVNIVRAVRAGRFREDLYHRIKTLTVQLTPLCERVADVAPLARHLLEHHERRTGMRTGGMTPAALELLRRYNWPGNVRELSGACARLVLHAPAGQLVTADVVLTALPELSSPSEQPAAAGGVLELLEKPYLPWPEALAVFEREYIKRVADDVEWSRTALSQRLGLDRKCVYRRLQRHRLVEPGAGGRAARGPQDGEDNDGSR